MKKLVFVVTGIAALGLAACNSNNQDAVNNAQLNQPAADNLNELSTDAANDAANSQAETLANQESQLNSQNAVGEDNATNPTDAQEQNVSGM